MFAQGQRAWPRRIQQRPYGARRTANGMLDELRHSHKQNYLDDQLAQFHRRTSGAALIGTGALSALLHMSVPTLPRIQSD